MANTKSFDIDKYRILRIVLLGVLGVAVLVVAALATRKPAPEPVAVMTMGNSQANLSNGGTVAAAEDGLYLSNLLEEEQVIRVKPGETEGTPIEGVKGKYLNMLDGMLYYVDAETQYLMRAKPDGTDITVLVEKPVTNLKISDGVLYYLDVASNNALFRLELGEGAEPVLLTDARILQYALAGGKIFFHDLNKNGESYYMNLDGTDVTRIKMAIGQTAFLAGQRLFYSDEGRDGALGYVSIEGTSMHGPNDLDTGVVLNAVADERFLYYVSARDGLMYRLDYIAEGAAAEKLTDYPVYGLQIAGDYIYFIQQGEEDAIGCIARGAGDKAEK